MKRKSLGLLPDLGRKFLNQLSKRSLLMSEKESGFVDEHEKTVLRRNFHKR